ncbi:MAG: hypothetical protein QXX17_04775 [Conexivisphaerales archaeon]
MFNEKWSALLSFLFTPDPHLVQAFWTRCIVNALSIVFPVIVAVVAVQQHGTYLPTYLPTY